MYKGIKRITACLPVLLLLAFALPALTEDEPPRIPSGDLAPVGAALLGDRKYDVYAGPGEDYLRPAEGKATVSAKGWVLSFGVEKGWTLITYQLATYQYRFGWIKGRAVSKELAFERVPATVMKDSLLTDDPLGKQGVLASLKRGSLVTRLAKMGIWAYVETETDGIKVRGFVRKDTLQYADAAVQYEDCLYPIRVEGEWGYMNYQGEVVLEPQWTYAGAFQGAGYAVVKKWTDNEMDDDTDKEGIIDRTGAYVVEPRYMCDEGYDGYYYGSKDTGVIWIYGASDEPQGFFDVASGCFSGLKYECYFAHVGSGRLIPVSEFTEEAQEWANVGFADRMTGDLVIPYQYDMTSGSWFEEGFAYVERYDPDTDTYIPLLINERNEPLTLPEGYLPAEFCWFSSGRYPVTDTKTGLYGYIDPHGKLAIPAKYGNARAFEGGTSRVTLNGEDIYIDPDGNAVPAPKKRGPQLFFGNTSSLSMDCGVMDEDGHILVPLDTGYVFDDSLDLGFNETYVDGLQALIKNGKYGFLDTKGNEAIPFEWDYAQNFQNGLAYVLKGDKIAYLDHGGKIVWQEE